MPSVKTETYFTVCYDAQLSCSHLVGLEMIMMRKWSQGHELSVYKFAIKIGRYHCSYIHNGI